MSTTSRLPSTADGAGLNFSIDAGLTGYMSTEPSNLTTGNFTGGEHRPAYHYIYTPELRYYFYLTETTKRLWRVFPPMLLLVGTLGNGMAIAVLSRKAMRRSNTAIYLIALAIVDTMVLYTGLLRQWMTHHFRTDVRVFGSLSCKIHTWLVYAILDMSVWILVALTLERLVSVYFPHRVKRHCTALTAFITLGVTATVLLAVNSHYLYGIDISYTDHRSRNDTVKIPFCTNMYDEYDHFVSRVWPWIDLCMYSFIPLTTIVICNSAIVFKVLLSRREARRIRPSATVTFHHYRGHDADSRKVSSMTAMLVVVNIVLLLTTAPISVYQVLRPYLNITWKEPIPLARSKMWWAVVNFLQYTNNSINFLLYCMSGSRFREELRVMFRRGHRVSPHNANTNASEVNLNRLRNNGNSPPTTTRQTDYNINTTTFNNTTFISPAPRALLQLPLESCQDLSQDDRSLCLPYSPMAQLSPTRRPSQYELDLVLPHLNNPRPAPVPRPCSSNSVLKHVPIERCSESPHGDTSVEEFCDQLSTQNNKEEEELEKEESLHRREAAAAEDDKGNNNGGLSFGDRLNDAEDVGDDLVAGESEGVKPDEERREQNDVGVGKQLAPVENNTEGSSTNV